MQPAPLVPLQSAPNAYLTHYRRSFPACNAAQRPGRRYFVLLELLPAVPPEVGSVCAARTTQPDQLTQVSGHRSCCGVVDMLCCSRTIWQSHSVCVWYHRFTPSFIGIWAVTGRWPYARVVKSFPDLMGVEKLDSAFTLHRLALLTAGLARPHWM